MQYIVREEREKLKKRKIYSLKINLIAIIRLKNKNKASLVTRETLHYSKKSKIFLLLQFLNEL